MFLQKTDNELVKCCGVIESCLHFDQMQLRSFGRWIENVSLVAFDARRIVDPRVYCR